MPGAPPSFSTLGPFTFSSAITTSNLLNAVTGLFAWLHHRENDGRARAAVYGSIFACFATGARLGAWVTRKDAGLALLPALALLFGAFVLTYCQRLRHLPEQTAM